MFFYHLGKHIPDSRRQSGPCANSGSNQARLSQITGNLSQATAASALTQVRSAAPWVFKLLQGRDQNYQAWKHLRQAGSILSWKTCYLPVEEKHPSITPIRTRPEP